MGAHHRRHYLKYRDLYQEAVRRFVCSHCVDRGDDGSCHSHESPCTVFRKLPELVELALEIHESRVQPYIDALRKHVCAACEDSDSRGRCTKRSVLDCGLDRYLPLVLEAVEEVERRLRQDRTGTDG